MGRWCCRGGETRGNTRDEKTETEGDQLPKPSRLTSSPVGRTGGLVLTQVPSGQGRARREWVNRGHAAALRTFPPPTLRGRTQTKIRMGIRGEKKEESEVFYSAGPVLDVALPRRQRPLIDGMSSLRRCPAKARQIVRARANCHSRMSCTRRTSKRIRK